MSTPHQVYRRIANIKIYKGEAASLTNIINFKNSIGLGAGSSPQNYGK